MMKRFLSIVLVLVICIALMPTMVLAASDTVELNVTVRDFKLDGILFDASIESIQGLVNEELGADKKPVYNLPLWQEYYGDTITQEKLNAFFNDLSGYNMKTTKTLRMRPDEEGYWTINSSIDENGEYQDGFFPIDNELFGNEDYHHNYHFSVEIHTKFKYVQDAEFEFSGDDDVWVFFNNKLVIDLGGIHGEESGFVKMADIADELGVKVGDVVNFDMFYMERCYSGSNMYIRTNFDFLNIEASAWAQKELAAADELGLIPDVLAGADLTKPITRAEFAAVAVKVYEKLSGTSAIPVINNPFTDTNDIEVLKAYNIGAVNGIENNMFAPRATTTQQQAEGYAQATREQALLIAVRMVQNLAA